MSSQWQNRLYFKEFHENIVGKRDELAFITKYLDQNEEMAKEAIELMR